MTQWSPEQDAALRSVDHWYRNERKNKQVFRLFGYAGTGKTTLAKHFAENITGQVNFATFTGKAAHVMASKGCEGASTIHRLIYQPKMASKQRLKQLNKELSDHEAHPDPNFEVIARVREELNKEKLNAGRMSFALNLASDLKQAHLLIIDEVSMVGLDMGRDLESFGIPILVLGDPEQLPPIKGVGYFTERSPDILLSEIHRQALNNPIISMSKMVREGKTLPLGTYGDSRVTDKRLEGHEMLEHDMVLTGLRKAKKACDDKFRKLLGHESPLPEKHDQVMCVKNNHQMGLLNGQIWECLESAVDTGDGTLSLYIKDTENELSEEKAVIVSEKLFRGEKLERWEHEEDIEEFEYAYAITVHKSQGSQWNNVALFDQKEKFPNWSDRDRRRWLYTGITRAAEKITVIRL